jgi:hypothetical protein
MAGNIETVLAALNAAGVRYLVVGGVAVVLHGHLRTTADLDLVVDLEPANVVSALDALTALGFRPRAPVPAASFADESIRQQWIDEKGMTVFSMWSPSRPGFEVDIFAELPLDFAAAAGRCVRAPLETTEVPVAAIEDLINLKRAAGRPQDIQDIEALEALRSDDGGNGVTS